MYEVWFDTLFELDYSTFQDRIQEFLLERGWGADLWRKGFLAKMYVETKELGQVRGRKFFGCRSATALLKWVETRNLNGN